MNINTYNEIKQAYGELAKELAMPVLSVFLFLKNSVMS